uniref:Down syndrome cell adhesion molecule n=1 Tax=Strigamia maritima TaxID=126957 RepID=T1JP64_STRMM
MQYCTQPDIQDPGELLAPKITPFSFPQKVFQGRSLIRISCVVYQGDLPITFQWLKNGFELNMNDKISSSKVDEYSSILKIEHIQISDAGNYTCVAINSAATASHTAQLTVHVPPKLVPFTFQDEFLSEGMLVRVSCVVSRGDLPLSISWLKDGEKLATELAISIRKFDEYSSVMSIDPVTINHAGNYTCTAQNHAGVATHTAQLTVRVPPKWVIEQEDVVTSTGKTLFLHCQAEGFPLPIISWEKAASTADLANRKSEQVETTDSDNIQIHSNGTLTFLNIQRSDEGLYICIANNGIQEPLSHVVSVRIQGLQHIFQNELAAPEFAQPKLEIKAKKSEEVEIVCEATGNWPILYSWTVNNHNINEDHTRYKIIDEQNKAITKSTSKLHISWVDRKDSTEFSCTATNDIGKSVMKANLIVQEEPDAPTILTPIRVANQTAELSWTLAYDGNSAVNRYHIQYKKEVDRWEDKVKGTTTLGTTTTVRIVKLKPATIYSFRVLAENQIGNSSFSETETAKTEESVPEGPPENVDVESMDANTLRVTWKPPQKNLWNGAIRGYNIGYKIHGSSDAFIH